MQSGAKMKRGSQHKGSKSPDAASREAPSRSAVADRAFCRFLLTIYQERQRWKSLEIKLPHLWKPLCNYEQMYAEVTTENAEQVFGSKDVISEDALRNLRRKLDIERHDDIEEPKAIIKEMKSVLNSIRNARTQLNYNLAEIDLANLDVEEQECGRPSSHLRGCYVQMLKDCNDVVESLWQDVCEADSILNSFVYHSFSHGSVITPKRLENLRGNFSERSARLLCSLRCYMEHHGVKLDQIKKLNIMHASTGLQETPE